MKKGVFYFFIFLFLGIFSLFLISDTFSNKEKGITMLMVLAIGMLIFYFREKIKQGYEGGFPRDENYSFQ